MIPQQQLNEYMQIVSYVSALSERDLRRVWEALDKANMKAGYDTLLTALHDIVAAYGDVSATAAAEFYEAAREASGLGATKAAVATLPTDEQIEVMMRNALGPLWEDTPRVAAAYSKLAGGTQRLTLKPGRDVIHQSVKRDKARYSIVPQGGTTCAFCLMLASRGAAYGSTQPHWHDNCDCICVPVFRDDDLPDINQQLHEEWQKVTKGEAEPQKAWRKHIESQAQGGE